MSKGLQWFMGIWASLMTGGAITFFTLWHKEKEKSKGNIIVIDPAKDTMTDPEKNAAIQGGRIKVSGGTGAGPKKCFDTVNGVYVKCPVGVN